MYVTPKQLNTIHYYYFAMGIFGFTNAIFVGLGTIYSYIFFSFYMINSGISWYISYVARKKMKEYVVVNSIRYYIEHLVATVLSVSGTTLFWMSGLIADWALLNTILVVNYFGMFLAGIWYIVFRTEFARELFTFYDNYIFKKSKDFILKAKSKHRAFFGFELISDNDIKNYTYGKIREVDNNLVSAWRNKKKLQYVLECLGRIELAIARKGLGAIKDKISNINRTSTDKETEVLESALMVLAERKREISEFEKKFYEKTSESQFI